MARIGWSIPLPGPSIRRHGVAFAPSPRPDLSRHAGRRVDVWSCPPHRECRRGVRPARATQEEDIMSNTAKGVFAEIQFLEPWGRGVSEGLRAVRFPATRRRRCG